MSDKIWTIIAVVAVIVVTLAWFVSSSVEVTPPASSDLPSAEVLEEEVVVTESEAEVAEDNGVDVVAQTESLRSKLLEMPYAEARDVILSEGWAPVPNANPDELMFVSRIMYQEGYIEVDVCSPTGTAPCEFFFKQGGQYLRVSTDNEAPQVSAVEVKDEEFDGLNPFVEVEDDNGGSGNVPDYRP